jgi:WD40 repeat protein
LSVERSKLNVERSGADGAFVDAANPWPGLESYTESSRRLFFGREKETDELSRLVRRQTLTVLFGQSGLGKSSLLHAGLFPLLRETDHLPLYLRLDHSGQLPMGDRRLPIEQTKHLPERANASATLPIGNRQSEIGNSLADQVKAALTAAFAAVKAEAPPFRADETLWEYFHRKDVDIWSAKNRLLTPVLAFDQFEEIFTLGRADEASRERSRVFLAELACLVENRAPAAVQAKLDAGTLDPANFNFAKPSCQVILSLREDFLPDLEGLKQSMPALVHNRLRLKKLSGTQALEIVTKPAPHLLADGVAEKIVEFVAGARGGSAERLAELDVEPPLLSVICRELNDRRRTLGQSQITADLVSGNRREILTDFYERSVADLPAPVRTFVEDHLLTKSGFRDNLALETALEFPGVTRPLLDTLVARRLLRIEDRLGVQRVELTHDVLAEVIRASRDARQQRLELAAAARRTRRQRGIIAGLAVAVAALLVGAFFGVRAQRSSAAQASQTDYALGSRLLDDGRLSEGLAYLVRAGRKDPTNPLIAPRLLSVLTSHNFALPVGSPLILPSPGLFAAFSANGRWIGVQSEDASLRLIDVEQWRVVRDYSFAQKVQLGGVTVPARNNDIFAVVLADNSILVVDTQTGQPRLPPIVPAGKIFGRTPRFAFSADGRWLAAAGSENVWVWEVATGKLVLTLKDNSYWRGFDFSPDEQSIVTTFDRQTQIWSVPDGQPLGPAIGSSTTVWLTIFQAGGQRLLIAKGGAAMVVDPATGALVGPETPLDSSSTFDVWVTPDSQRLVYTATNRTATVLDVATGKPVYAPLLHGGNPQTSQIVADGKILFTNSVDGLFRLWDLKTGNLLAEPTARQPHFTPTFVSDDGRTVVMFTADGLAYRLRPGLGAAAPLALPRTPATTTLVNFAQGTPARVAWMTHTELKVIDIASGRPAPGGFPLPTQALSIGRSPFGGTLGAGDAILLRSAPGVWRALTLGESGVVNDVLVESNATSFSGAYHIPRGLVVSGAQQALRIWDLKTGRLVLDLPSATPIRSSNTAIAFSPDGKRVVYQTMGDSVIHVVETDGGKELLRLQLPGRAELRTIRYVPDGSRILMGDDWGAVHIWDAATGKLLRSNQRHRTTVTRFDFSLDGRRYASLSNDGSVQVWDASNDQPIGELLEQPGGAGRAEFSPDGTRLVTSASTGSARVWDVATGLPVTEAMQTGGEPVNIVAYSSDGRFVDLHGNAGAPFQHVRYWSVPPAASGPTPDWLLTLATICGGQTLSPEGKYADATREFAKIDNVRREVATAPANDPTAAWGRWILSDDPNRSIAPGFTITPAEAAKMKAEWLKK